MRARSLPVAVALALLALLGAVPQAGADAVMPHMTACPTGSLGDVSHTGPWCRPATCTVDADCERFWDSDRTNEPAKPPKEPMACVDHPLCVRVEKVTQKGGWAGGQTFEKTIVQSACDANGGCPGGATCAKAKHCVPRRLAGASPGPIPGTSTPAPPTNPTIPPATTPPAPTPASTSDAGASETPGAPVAPSSCGRCALGGAVDGDATGTMAALFGAAIALLTTRRLRAPRRRGPARSRRSSSAPRR